MFNKPKEFQLLVDAFKSLPSIGQKNANKYAYFLLKQDKHYINEFIDRINSAYNNLKYCIYCHNLANQDVCTICKDDERDNTLCIVESIVDLDHIENAHFYKGYYHVLHGEINPKKNISVNNIFIDDLKSHIKKFNIKEVIIATSLSIEGEITAEYIKEYLNDIDINLYRIGFGLPSNASINYSDEQTLKFALINKRKLI